MPVQIRYEIRVDFHENTCREREQVENYGASRELWWSQQRRVMSSEYLGASIESTVFANSND